MLRRFAPFLVILLAATVTPAHAVVKGTSSQSPYTVRLAGPFYCSGVAVARRVVVTAAHCARTSMRVYAGGHSVGVAGISKTGTLDDGRKISVSGDAAILRLSAPLNDKVVLAPVGDGEGDTFVISGYGTTDERWRGSFGKLHEASLVAAEPRALVDPKRDGSISASACFGDSGGPVMRGGQLVGIITRAAHPHPRIACGHLTRWAPVTLTGETETVAAEEKETQSRPVKRIRRAKPAETQTASLFSNWFVAKKKETRRHADAAH